MDKMGKNNDKASKGYNNNNDNASKDYKWKSPSAGGGVITSAAKSQAAESDPFAPPSSRKKG
mgnify:CR=1 FL=1